MILETESSIEFVQHGSCRLSKQTAIVLRIETKVEITRLQSSKYLRPEKPLYFTLNTKDIMDRLNYMERLEQVFLEPNC